MKASKNWVGRKVRMTNAKAHEENPQWYPAVGNIGIVVPTSDDDWAVQWDKDSGVDKDGIDRDYTWYCSSESLELVEDDSTTMPYDEIWEMLKPKMEKNGLKSHFTYVRIGATVDDDKVIDTYDEEDVQKCITLAYKMGYERAIKGRPFKYGEKKVKGDDVD